MDLQIALKLQQLRKQHGLSQEQLAENLGVSRQAVSKWERGEASPDTDNLIALAKLYNVSLDQLLQVDTTPLQEQTNVNVADTVVDTSDIDQNDDSDDEECVGQKRIFRVLNTINPIVCVAVFFLLGYVWGWWHPAWLVFLAIPVISSIFAAIEQKRLCAFAFPILVTIGYLLMGFVGKLWHPGWLVFLSIPVYYTFAGWVDSTIKR